MKKKHHNNALAVYFLTACILLLASCSTVPPQENSSPSVNRLLVKLTKYKQSAFNQVEARFVTHQSKALVFRVLSDIKKTPQWLDKIKRLEVVAEYNHHQFLLRSIIDSPWPFQDREIITCVNNDFLASVTTINIFSCSERVSIKPQYLRLSQVESSWTIKDLPDSSVEITYKTWMNPSGNVPAFIFNSQLLDTTKVSLKKLQTIIENASLAQYYY